MRLAARIYNGTARLNGVKFQYLSRSPPEAVENVSVYSNYLTSKTGIPKTLQYQKTDLPFKSFSLLFPHNFDYCSFTIAFSQLPGRFRCSIFHPLLATS